MSKEFQDEIARLEAEGAEIQQRFAVLMRGLATGETTIDQACEGFRESANVQLDIAELRLRMVGDAIQSAGIHAFPESLNFNFPTIG
jgi:hypothetical protein